MTRIINWISDNKEWVLSGIGVAIALTLAKLIRFIVHKVRQRKSKLHLVVHEEASRFFRTVVSPQNHKDKDTVIRPRVSVQNSSSEEITIVRYKLRVLSPRRHRCKITQLIPNGHRVRYRLAQHNSVWLDVQYPAGTDKEFRLGPGTQTTTTLSFEVPFAISREAKTLKCKLKIWDQNNHSPSCKFKVTREGY